MGARAQIYAVTPRIEPGDKNEKEKKKFITGGLIHLPQVLQGIKYIGKLHCKSLPLAAVMTAMLGWHMGSFF